MNILAHFSNERSYFGEYNRDNDIDPNTQRSGINFFRFKVIGYLLHKLGFAHKVHYIEGEGGCLP